VPKPPAANPRPLRRKTLDAIHAFADGKFRTIAEAADSVGMRREALSRVLQTPLGQQALTNRLALMRSTAGRARAQHAVLHLIEHAKSDDVRLRASQWLEQTEGMGQTRGEAGSNGSGGGQGIVVNVVFSRIDANGGEIRSIGAHLETPNSQTIEALAVSQPDRILAKGEAEPSAATEPRGRR
jgi:hypothetical protein